MSMRLLLLLAMLVGVGSGAWAFDEMVTFLEEGYENGEAVETYDGTDFSIAFDKGTNNNAPKYYTTGAAIRTYGGNYFTITSTTKTITQIALTFGSGDGSNAITTDVGTYTNGSWVGSESSVTFTIGGTTGHRRIASVAVTYLSDANQSVAPSITGDESFLTSTTVTITAAEGASIYYTLDGTNPTTSSTAYSAPFTLTETATVKAIAKESGKDASAVTEKTFTKATVMTVAEARAAIDAGTGVTGVYATGIVSAIPTAWSTQYNNITFNFVDESGDTEFLQAFRCVSTDDADASTVAVGDIVVVYGNLTKYNTTYEFGQGCKLISLTHPTAAVAAPTFSPDAGTCQEAQMVAISCTTSGATIYYTTDGSEPTNASTQYSGPFAVSTTTTIKAIAIKGSDQSAVATATYHFCSADSPYTVTQALAFYDYPANGIYVSGIVSTAPTMAPTTNGEMTYYISVDGEATNQLEVYKGKGLDGEAFTAEDDLKVGDEVTIFGNVKIYNSTKEFDTGNYLVAFNRPTTPVVPTFNIIGYSDPVEFPASFPSVGGVGCTYGFTVDNFTGTIDDIQYVCYNANNETISTPSWLGLRITSGSSNNFFEISMREENTSSEARTVSVKLYVTVDGQNYYSEPISITQEGFVSDYATLPFEFDGGKTDIATTNGLTHEGLDTDYNSSPKLKFNNTGDNLILRFDERPGTLTFDIKGNSFSGGTFTVQTSEDGETYTNLKSYTELGSTLSETFANLGENVRYIKWIYTEKVSGNVGLGNIKLAAYTELQSYTLTWTAGENIDLYVFDAEDDTNPLESGCTVKEGTTIMISPDPAQGYVLDELSVKDGDDQPVQLTEHSEGGYWTFIMPASNATITATAKQEEEEETYTFEKVTNVDDLAAGDIIIFVNEGDEQAMSTEQKTNNRGAAAITLQDGSVTAGTAVQQVVLEGDADGWYFNVGNGYLYAASSNSNWLKTQAEADDNAKATITLDDEGNLIIAFQGEFTRNQLRYNPNNGNPLFSCYNAESTTGSAPQIYRLVPETPKFTLTWSADAGATIYVEDNEQSDPYHSVSYEGSSAMIAEGTEVFVFFAIEEGYVLEKIIVKSGQDVITPLDWNENSFTFTMPGNETNIHVYTSTVLSGTWVKTGLDEITEDDIFVIVDRNDLFEERYAMRNSNGTDRAPSAVPVDREWDFDLQADKITSTVYTNMVWTVRENDGYVFYPYGDTENSLYDDEDVNGARVGINENNIWTLENNYIVGDIILQNQATGRYLGVYNRQDWRCYDDMEGDITHQVVHFYRLVADYRRDVTIGNWGTICLPKAGTIEGAQLYSIAGKVLNSTGAPVCIVLKEEDELEAGVPYIFQAMKPLIYVTYTDDDAVEEADNLNGLYGSFQGQDVAEGMYILKNNEVRLCGTGNHIGANRAYIDMDNVPDYNGSGAGVKLFVEGGDADGMSLKGMDNVQSARIYNLAGQRLQRPMRGLNIINGKKVFVK